MRRGTGKEVVPYQERPPTPSLGREIARQLGWLVVRVIANTAQPKPPPPQREAPRPRRRRRGSGIHITDTDDETVIEINRRGSATNWTHVVVLIVAVFFAIWLAGVLKGNPPTEERTEQNGTDG